MDDDSYSIIEGPICYLRSRTTRERKEQYYEFDSEEEGDQKKKEYSNKTKMKFSSFKELQDLISSFSGDDDAINIDCWLYKYEEVANNCSWSDLQKVMYCKRLLRGSAKTFIRLEKCCFCWKQLKSSLLNKFSRNVNITKKQGSEWRLDEISNEYNNQGRKARMYLRRPFYRNQDDNIENSKLILNNSCTVKELKEKFEYYDCAAMMYNLKLQDNTRREKQLPLASGSQDMK